MISINSNEMNHIIEVEVKGKISENDIHEFEQYFNQKKENQEELNLLLAVEDAKYSLNGLIEDFKFDIKHWNDFHKIAVVSDDNWIELGSKLTDILPTIEVKHFNDHEKDKAKAWLN
ncbi:SpoIIAA-like [Mesobacillus persicus]|uniref:SpoIIAA-like n=1 Tax=Mesobacillus persicus TaxID=930146 RepID=A0A1H8AY03_9BACI|nr:STAS/SEC14 domain-containing protein [Mesobacillus persicus]SEM75632.1 SpoIIAA-like [Mesobacillus persicus]